MTYVQEYLQGIEDEKAKSALLQIRDIVHELVPDAEETKSYGLPTFKYKSKYLIAFAVFKDHLSVFPGSHAIEMLQEELIDYKISKGTIQFTTDNPLPESIIKKIILARKNDIEMAL